MQIEVNEKPADRPLRRGLHPTRDNYWLARVMLGSSAGIALWRASYGVLYLSPAHHENIVGAAESDDLDDGRVAHKLQGDAYLNTRPHADVTEAVRMLRCYAKMMP
jgi:hypothetical protein